MNSTQKILRLPAVKEVTGLSRSSIYLKISRGDFPKQISLGSRACGWLSTDVDTWIEQRIKHSRSFERKNHENK